MSFSEVMIGVAIGVSVSIIATGITFYLKDYLRERAKFRKFEEKLKQIAGKEAEVIISNIGLVKIDDINKQGLTVKNELGTIFLPMERVLVSDITVPVANYDVVRKEWMKKNLEETLDIVFPPLMDKLKEVLVKEFLSTDSDLSAIIGIKIRGELKDEGIPVKKLSKEKELTVREIVERINKDEGKKEDNAKSNNSKEDH